MICHTPTAQAAKLLIMGTLGLAAPDTRAAMEAAVKAAHEGGCKVFVDINWRPVFWGDLQEAKRVITEFLANVDLVKISDADLEFLYEMDPDAALKDPCSVGGLCLHGCLRILRAVCEPLCRGWSWCVICCGLSFGASAVH